MYCIVDAMQDDHVTCGDARLIQVSVHTATVRQAMSKSAMTAKYPEENFPIYNFSFRLL